MTEAFLAGYLLVGLTCSVVAFYFLDWEGMEDVRAVSDPILFWTANALCLAFIVLVWPLWIARQIGLLDHPED